MAIVVSISFTIYWTFYLPGPGKAVALLGSAAVFLALRGEIGTIRGIERILWTAIVFGLLRVEIRAIDSDRSANQKEQAEIRTQERQQFEALIVRLEANISEITAGKSFCYVEIRQWMPGELRAAILGKSDIPLSDVHITILDLDDFHQLHGLSERGLASIQKNFDFPFTTHYNGVWKYLYSLRFGPAVISKSYNITIRARNGIFTERLRLQRVHGTWLSAKRVDASYWDKTMGWCSKKSIKTFPRMLSRLTKIGER